MKFLAVFNPTFMYHGCFTRKTFREEKFRPVNMRICVCLNVRKNREINNGEKYIVLGIYLQLGFLYKSEVTSLGSRDFVRRSVKVLTNSLTLRTRIR